MPKPNTGQNIPILYIAVSGDMYIIIPLVNRVSSATRGKGSGRDFHEATTPTSQSARPDTLIYTIPYISCLYNYLLQKDPLAPGH